MSPHAQSILFGFLGYYPHNVLARFILGMRAAATAIITRRLDWGTQALVSTLSGRGIKKERPNI
jgi:hypothetical protein